LNQHVFQVKFVINIFSKFVLGNPTTGQVMSVMITTPHIITPHIQGADELTL